MKFLLPQTELGHCQTVLPARSTSIGTTASTVAPEFHEGPMSTPLSVSTVDTAPPMSGRVPST